MGHPGVSSVTGNASARLSDLLGFVAEHPRAVALAISNNGLEWSRLPGVLRSEINPYSPDLDPGATSTLDLLDPRDRRTVMRAFAECWRNGTSECNVAPIGDDAPTALLMWDLRDEVGSVIAVIVPDLIVGSESVAPLQLRPRVLRHTATESGITLTVDYGTYQLLGWVDEQILNRSRVDFVHPEDRPDAIMTWVEMLEHPNRPVRQRTRYRHHDDRWVWFEITLTNMLAEHGYVQCDMLDITESMAAFAALHKREQMLRHLTEAMPQGILHLCSGGTILFANEYLFTIAGATLSPRELLELVVDADRALLYSAYGAALTGIDSELDVSLVRADGSERRCHTRLRALEGTDAGVLVSVEDITDRWRLTKQLERQAATDPLTGVLNRRATLDLLATVQHEASVKDSTTTIAFLDLNGFKRINDEHGHHVGDTVLTTITGRMSETIGPDNHLGRLGGDEFLVICQDTDLIQAQKLVDKLRIAVAAEVIFEDQVIRCETSCGLVSDQAGSMTVQALIAAADAQMYLDKDRVRTA